MALRIYDGYTLRGETSGKGNYDESQPVILFEYRPPTAREMAEHRYAVLSAKSGQEQHAERVRFLLARLVSWDVQGADGKPLPLGAQTIEAVPDPILSDLVAECGKWKPKPQGDAEKN